jgi:hypothetical protein
VEYCVLGIWKNGFIGKIHFIPPFHYSNVPLFQLGQSPYVPKILEEISIGKVISLVSVHSFQCSVFGVQVRKTATTCGPRWKISFGRKCGMSPSGFDEGILPEHCQISKIFG